MFMTAVGFDDRAGGKCRVGVGNRERLRECSVHVNHLCATANDLLLRV